MERLHHFYVPHEQTGHPLSLKAIQDLGQLEAGGGQPS